MQNKKKTKSTSKIIFSKNKTKGTLSSPYLSAANEKKRKDSNNRRSEEEEKDEKMKTRNRSRSIADVFTGKLANKEQKKVGSPCPLAAHTVCSDTEIEILSSRRHYAQAENTQDQKNKKKVDVSSVVPQKESNLSKARKAHSNPNLHSNINPEQTKERNQEKKEQKKEIQISKLPLNTIRARSKITQRTRVILLRPKRLFHVEGNKTRNWIRFLEKSKSELTRLCSRCL